MPWDLLCVIRLYSLITINIKLIKYYCLLLFYIHQIYSCLQLRLLQALFQAWSSDPWNAYFKLRGRCSFGFYVTSFSMYKRCQKYQASRFSGGNYGAAHALAPPGPPWDTHWFNSQEVKFSVTCPANRRPVILTHIIEDMADFLWRQMWTTATGSVFSSPSCLHNAGMSAGMLRQQLPRKATPSPTTTVSHNVGGKERHVKTVLWSDSCFVCFSFSVYPLGIFHGTLTQPIFTPN